MKFIEGKELVEAVFGYWPTFHDGEVLALAYECKKEGGVDVTFAIHVFESDRLPDDRGFYGMINQTRVTFRLSNCADDALTGFGSQNVLSRLEFAESRDADPRFPILVTFNGLVTFDGTIRCQRVAVIDVRPF